MAGSNLIGSLKVALGLDSAEFDKGLKRVQDRVGSLNVGKGLVEGFKGVDGLLSGVASQAGVLGAALSTTGVAGAAAAAGLVGAFKAARSAMAFGDEISDTAAKIGVTTDALQEYRYAVHQLGGEYGDADAALQQFSVAFGAAHAALTKKAVKPFEALGLDPKSFASTEDALQAVIGKISALKSSAEQAAIADKLGLTPMLTALRAGAGQIDVLRQKAHDLGFVMDSGLVQKASEANDKFEDLKHIAEVQLHSAFVDLAPALLATLEVVDKIAEGFRGIIDAVTAVENKSAQGLRNRRVELTAEITDLGIKQLAGRKLSIPEQQALARYRAEAAKVDAALADRAASAAPPPPHGGTSLTSPGAAAIAGASDEAIAAARKAELSARMGLTANIEKSAALKLEEVEQERADANQKLRDQAKEGKITKAAAESAMALNDKAASEKKEAVLRQARADHAAHEVAQAEAVARYTDQVSQLQAQFAGTAAERNAFELKALDDRQARERRRLETETAADVTAGKLTQAEADALLSAQGQAQAAERVKAQWDARVRQNDEMTQQLDDLLASQEDSLRAQQSLAASSYGQAVIGKRLLETTHRRELLEAQRLVDDAANPEARDRAQQQLDDLRKRHEAETVLAARQTTLARAIGEATSATAGLKQAIRSHDWAGIFDELARTIDLIRNSFVANGLTGGLMTAAAAGSSLLGGKAGSALNTGLGAGFLASSLGASGAIGGLGLFSAGSTLVANGATVATGIGAGALGGMAGAMGAIAAAAPYIAIVAGLASLFIGSKPSNHAGIATLTPDSFQFVSSGKETDETKNAVLGAAQTIVQNEKALEALGISLKTTVAKLDLGTRDLTHIFLSNGQELRSAVGDAQAAAETALQAVLKDATYVDDAQKSLVTSMMAAGKGFDDITAALQTYATAQAISGQLADQILQLTDPQAYDLKQVHDGIAAQHKSAEALYVQGMLTAAQLAAINTQLDTLEALQVDKTMEKYAAAVGDAATAVAQSLRDAAAEAQSALKDAIDAQISTLQKTASQFSGLAGSLHAFQESLKPADVAASPAAALLAARNAFLGVAGRSDADSLGKLQGLGQSYIEAAKSGARSATEVARVQAQVRNAIAAGAASADAQASLAQQQLDALTGLETQLGLINASVLSIPQALANLMAANTAAGVANPVLKDASGRTIIDAARGVGVDALGNPMPWALDALGLPHFATAGGFRVGGIGPADSRLAQMALSPGEYVNVSHGDSMGAMASQIGALRQDLRAGMGAIAANTRQLAQLQSRWDGDGLPATRTA